MSVPTPPDELYRFIFQLKGLTTIEDDKKILPKYQPHYDFLLNNHLQYTELDRPWETQYTYCLLWSNLVDVLWQYRKTKTKSIPFALPLRHTHQCTDSYFIYYIHQLIYLLDSMLNILQRYSSSSYSSFPSTATDQSETLATSIRATIYMVSSFSDQYIDKIPVFDPKYIGHDMAFECTILIGCRIRFHLLRLYFYLLLAQACHVPKVRVELYTSLEKISDQALMPLFKTVSQHYSLVSDLPWSDLVSLNNQLKIYARLQAYLSQALHEYNDQGRPNEAMKYWMRAKEEFQWQPPLPIQELMQREWQKSKVEMAMIEQKRRLVNTMSPSSSHPHHEQDVLLIETQTEFGLKGEPLPNPILSFPSSFSATISGEDN